MLHYKDINPEANQVVTLIHGLGASLDMWEHQFAAFEAAGYRIIAPDMHGFGNSSEADLITIESMANDVATLLDRLGIKQSHIIGLSMGGAIAQSFALQYPEKTQKLVLANTAARFANKFFGKMYVGLRYILLKVVSKKHGAKSIAKYVFPHKNQQEFRDEFIKQIMMASEKAYFQATKTIIEHDLRKQLGNIKAPALVVAGKQDKVTMPFILRELHRLIPHSKLVTLNGGHVTPVDCADDFNKEILAFLNKNH